VWRLPVLGQDRAPSSFSSKAALPGYSPSGMSTSPVSGLQQSVASSRDALLAPKTNAGRHPSYVHKKGEGRGVHHLTFWHATCRTTEDPLISKDIICAAYWPQAAISFFNNFTRVTQAVRSLLELVDRPVSQLQRLRLFCDI
jgi:hypothetical protein